MATNVTMNRRVHAEGRLGLQLHYTSKGDLPAPRGFGNVRCSVHSKRKL